MPARNRIQICLDDLEMAYIDKIAKVRRTSISGTARLCVQAGMRNDNDGLSVLLKMELATLDNQKTELEGKLSEVRKERDRIAHDLEEIAKQEHQTELTAPSRPNSSPSIPTVKDPMHAQTAEEKWRASVGYVLNPPANLLKEIKEKLERSVFNDARVHPDWLAALPQEQQTALPKKMNSGKGRK